MAENSCNDKVSANYRHTAETGEQAGIVLHSQWDEFCRLRRSVLGHLDTDSIHDLRVASRRLRASLGLFGPFIAKRAAKALSKEIRRITRELGHVRNIDEALIYVTSLPAVLPISANRLRKAREKEIRAVIKVLKRFPCREMGLVLRKALAGLSGRISGGNTDHSLPVYLADTSVQRFQELHDLLAPAAIPENVELRHRLRIAIKKWRYLLETIGQVCGQDYGATLEVLKEYQALLGKLNDMVEFGVLCGMLKLPPEEAQQINAALERDTACYLADFIQVAMSRPLQYTFHL
jgi:CHAD domain-containing protein